MFYTIGFMKSVVAPTLGMAFWAWFVTEAVIFPELSVNEAAIAGILMAVPLAVVFGVFCHFTRGILRAVGVITAVIAILFFTPGLSSDNNPDFMLADMHLVLPPMMMVIFTGFFGFCFWPVIYPREILAIQGDIVRGGVQVALEDSNGITGKHRR